MTPKQEAFARAYIKTGKASEAYRRAYDAESMSPSTVTVEANRLLKHPVIAPMIENTRQQAAERLMVTLEGLTDELEHARLLAMRDDKGASAAVAAIMGKAKLHGFLVERSENTNTNYNISDEPMSEEEWEDIYAGQH